MEHFGLWRRTWWFALFLRLYDSYDTGWGNQFPNTKKCRFPQQGESYLADRLVCGCILRNNLYCKFYKLHLGRNSCAICARFYLQYWYNGIERRCFHGNLLFRQQGYFPNQRLRRRLLSSTGITWAQWWCVCLLRKRKTRPDSLHLCSCPGVLLFFARPPKASGWNCAILLVWGRHSACCCASHRLIIQLHLLNMTSETAKRKISSCVSSVYLEAVGEAQNEGGQSLPRWRSLTWWCPPWKWLALSCTDAHFLPL